MYGIFNKQTGQRLGSVWKVAGEPPKTRWQAFASGDRKHGFPTKRQAIEWLMSLGDEERKAANDKT